MSTRAGIGIRENGYIRLIYCHFDGYPEHLGVILNAHYTYVTKVRKLIALGDISVLGERVEPIDPTNHTFNRPEPGTTVAYHRDRGEPKRKAFRFEENKINEIDFSELDFIYVYDVITKEWLTIRVELDSKYNVNLRPWNTDYDMLIDMAIEDKRISKPRYWK